MDLLFSRYASPFVLIDNYIGINRFSLFISDFAESENERQMWEYYIHRVHNMTFAEFKASVNKEEITDEQVGTIITDSFDIMNDFTPVERG